MRKRPVFGYLPAEGWAKEAHGSPCCWKMHFLQILGGLTMRRIQVRRALNYMFTMINW